MSETPGPLALVGGGEWREGCDFDADLLAASGGSEVVVLPTAAAYEHPDHAVERATRWFEGLGATVRPVPAVDRTGARDEANVAAVRDAAVRVPVRRVADAPPLGAAADPALGRTGRRLARRRGGGGLGRRRHRAVRPHGRPPRAARSRSAWAS